MIQGGTATVTADPGSDHDVDFVDFYLNGTLVYTDRQAPFSMNFQATSEFGGPDDVIAVSAVATDTSGNRGAPIAANIIIVADAPPTAVISSLSPSVEAATGQRVELTVSAQDDRPDTARG